MSFAAVLILAVSLSMDALGIGISYGLRGIRVSWKARVVICAMSMMVTGAAVGLGSVLCWRSSPCRRLSCSAAVCC